NMPSRFAKEIPEELCDFAGLTVKKTSAPSSGFSSGFQKPRASAFSNSFSSQKTAPAASTDTVYTVGQQVIHKTFGKGMIISVTPMAGDHILEIAFENVGTKKIMANYSKLTV
ncbi:MAG: ATP-dependent DNA helicase PcrA, partial [Acutalibacteraceae bacterium]|nr:ATP-dependent DNA helicase PcrA [Acutalibacteraceae bacterium]